MMLPFLMKMKNGSDAAISLLTDTMELTDALFGLPPSGCAPQGSNGFWPSQKQPEAPAPTPAPASPQVPSQPSQGLNPKPRWPFNPGQSGWPGQNPSFKPGASGWPFGPGQEPGRQSGWPSQDPAGFRPDSQWTPIQTGNLNVPYNLNLKRGIYDKMMLTIMGKVKPNAKQFTVNFVRGNDIAFHLNPRFNDKGMQAVVRNTKVGECWGTEERHTQGGFPFMAGQSFEMRILITFEEFKVAVNGAQLFDYKHRVRELNQIDRINILDDVTLTYVSVDTIP
ncbi:hypothetical protein UPYG_G00255860 [Umbra pygmaea]|uniref:Galectin n=1 Tax=Umbra pygmaea TaxID=75934 RepID=A0ABD0W8E3_UMBPY